MRRSQRRGRVRGFLILRGVRIEVGIGVTGITGRVETRAEVVVVGRGAGIRVSIV